MTTLKTVLGWRPADLAGAADDLVADRRTLVALQDELDAGAPPASWRTGARGPAVAEHRALGRRLAATVAEVASVAASVDDAAAAVEAVQRELESTLSWAAAHGFAVDRATGRVGDTICVADPEAAADRQLAVTELADRIEQALRAADHADAQLAEALGRAAAGQVDTHGTDLAGAAEAGAAAGAHALLAPPDGTPADAAAWWRSLSEEQQELALAEHPEWLGNTDGIPAAVRDQANRSLLDDHRSALESEEARLQQEYDDALAAMAAQGWVSPGVLEPVRRELELVRSKLDGLDAVERVLDSPGDRQLLVLDPSGDRQLTAAIAVGDVDTADHVAVFTPGFTTTVAGSIESYDRSMDSLRAVARDEVRKYGTGGTVAAISWLGYEAPQWSEWTDLGGDFVTSDRSARTGGAALADFYRGIDASRETDPHLTALGHSYGSTTTGFALRETTGVDSAVIFGSPGLGTSHLEDLNLPQGEMYRIEARRDAVADAGVFGIDPTYVEGVTGLSAKDTELGGQRFEESTGHSAYLRDDTTSQHNLAAVVAGVPDRLVTDDGRGFGDLLSWPLPWTY